MDEPIGKYSVVSDSLRPVVSLTTEWNRLEGSVYEVVRIIDGVPLFLEDHVKRLGRSAAAAGLPLAADTAHIHNLVDILVAACDIVSGNVRIVLGHDGRLPSPALLVHFVKSRYPDDEMYRSGVPVGILRGERSRPGVKYSDTPVRKEADALLFGGVFYEMLLVNDDGLVTEGSRTNVFFIRDNTLVTPPARNVLPGITRQKVIEIAQKGGIPLSESAVRVSELAKFDALFLTGTSANVLPVRSVGDLLFRTDGALLRRIMESYDRCVASYLDNAARRMTDGSGRGASLKNEEVY